MYISVLFLLLASKKSYTKDDNTDEFWIEQFRLERLQAQCNAWCYQNYGNYTTVKNDWGEGVRLFDCQEGNADCFNCTVACSREFYKLGECFRHCGGDKVCQKACHYHETLYRKDVDLLSQRRNITTKAFPAEIYENPNGRTESDIQLKWHQTDNYFLKPTAVTFMVILYNRTSHEPIDDEKDIGLYINNTPNYTFTISELSHKYCYLVRMISVTPDYVIGSSRNMKLFSVNPVINVVNITARSAHIWLDVPWCIESKQFDIVVLDSSRDNNMQAVSPLVNTAATIFEADVTALQPNQMYSIMVERSNDAQDFFSWHKLFRTGRAVPSSAVAVTAVTDITHSSMTYYYKVADEEKLWGIEPLYFLLRVNLANRSEYTEYNASRKIDLIAKKWVVPDLQPYTIYCMKIAVGNEYGLGPWSQGICNKTISAGPSAPEQIFLTNTTSTSISLSIYRPLHQHGQLDYYLLEYIDYRTPLSRIVNVSDGPVTNATLYGLNPFTTYNISITGFTRKEEESDEHNQGEVTSVTQTTLMDKPGRAPIVSSCFVTRNKTHTNVTMTWIPVDDRYQHGTVDRYLVTVRHSVHIEDETKFWSQTFVKKPGKSKVMVAVTPDLDLMFSDTERIIIQMAVATPKGTGPFSRNSTCEIEELLDTSIATILIPIFAVVSVIFLALFAFFYFFRFRTYKKTPYEEIKKLVKPEAFAPCQHCSHNRDPKKWDVFICHVSEDLDYILKLKEAFVREKIDVFFAKDELSWGCSLHRVINDGLINSKYGLVVLSKHFFGKCNKWTSNELSNLHTKSRLYSEDLILPVWKDDVTERDVGEFDMTLLGIKALKEADMTVEEMAVELKKKLKEADTCWGCKSLEYNWSQSDYSAENSPVHSLHTTLL